MISRRLVNLSLIGEYGSSVACTVAALQAAYSRTYGHWLDVESEGVWRQLVQAARSGEAERLRLRCVRCETSANLAHWIMVGARLAAPIEEVLLQFPFLASELVFMMHSECPGDAHASEIARLLVVYLPEDKDVNASGG